MFYCGLDKPVSDLKRTVGQISKYAGLENVVGSLLSILPSLTATLNPSNYAGKRNALWFNPPFNFQSTLQLHFQLDAKHVLHGQLTDELRGFEITEAVVICRKVLIERTTTESLEGIDQGSVSFAVGCTITAERRVEMMAGINFGISGIAITMDPRPGTLGHILAWLENVAGLGPVSVHALSGPDWIFPGSDMQRLEMYLSTAKDLDRPQLASFCLGLEFPMHFIETPSGYFTQGVHPVHPLLNGHKVVRTARME